MIKAIARCGNKYLCKKKSFEPLEFPILSQFYDPPEFPPILENKTTLGCVSVGIYFLTAVAFGL